MSDENIFYVVEYRHDGETFCRGGRMASLTEAMKIRQNGDAVFAIEIGGLVGEFRDGAGPSGKDRQPEYRNVRTRKTRVRLS